MVLTRGRFLVQSDALVTGSFADLCVLDVAAAIGFYRELLGLELLVDHGWYAELGIGSQVFVAFVQADHETVPAEAGSRPSGVLVSFEVDDAAAVADRAAELAADVVLELTVELGQRHLMVRDPDGAVIDIIERVPLNRDDLVRLATLRRQQRAQSRR